MAVGFPFDFYPHFLGCDSGSEKLAILANIGRCLKANRGIFFALMDACRVYIFD